VGREIHPQTRRQDRKGLQCADDEVEFHDFVSLRYQGSSGRPFDECTAMHMLVAIRPWELSKFAEMQRRK